MQGNLFDKNEIPILWYEDGIVCNNCGIPQPVTQFQRMQSGEIKRKCRTCARNQSNLIKELKKIHPYPDDNYACPICERTINEISKKGQKRLQNWVLDHCHDTETFRGWVCHHCNTGLGAFSDCLDRIQKAVIYLMKHKEKKNETNT
ncbi:MAG: hypothetical protein CBB97_23515 [Candidatus Endolissoclinum sp. TMED37]|nr:MAG: hypothetical protein CBB97_23515 [Candidatus Endolissoclinum sp. TMED37]|tara:strand:- start:2980 stop:3420 length:441 start_codon:yes stop_codon:yes gene_type:complete